MAESLNSFYFRFVISFGAEVLQQCGYSLSESAASRLHASSPGMWTEMVQRSLLRVFPNGSRVDSSNFSPLEFWNAGVPMGKFNNKNNKKKIILAVDLSIANNFSSPPPPPKKKCGSESSDSWLDMKTFSELTIL